jgi:hypothetical protein
MPIVPRTGVAMRLLARVVPLIVLAGLNGCGSIGQDSIVGRWEEIDGNNWSEYFPDGTAFLNDGSVTVNARWERLEDDRLRLIATVFGIEAGNICLADIQGDDVTFDCSDGGVSRYRRAP